MDVEGLAALADPRVLAAVAAEAAGPDPADPVGRSTALRRAGFSPAEASTILTQAALRRRARGKLGPAADTMLLTRAGLEQATRAAVAEHRAARIAATGARRVADLGCGIGGDARALAAAGLGVLAVERDPVTAALAARNLAPWPGAEVRTGDAEDADLTGVDGAWLDPARRTAGHEGTRRVAPAAYAPPLAFARALAERMPVGLKLSPAHDRDDLPLRGEAQWTSSRGEVVETTLWSGAWARPGVGRAALVLSGGAAAELTAPRDAEDEEPGPLGGFVHEPDGAVIRARLVGDLARATRTRPVAPGIAYLTGDDPVASPFLASFAVDAVLPLDRRAIARELRARGVGRLEIKKRGVDLDPARFRGVLGLRGDGEAVLIATRLRERRAALLCRRV